MEFVSASLKHFEMLFISQLETTNPRQRTTNLHINSTNLHQKKTADWFQNSDPKSATGANKLPQPTQTEAFNA